MINHLEYIDASKIACALNIKEIVKVTKKVFEGLSTDNVSSPKKYSLALPSNSSTCMSWINSMPSYIKDEGIAGIKWISVCSENKKHNLPTTNGIIVLNDINTGIPFAILDAELITHYRTAASVLLAARVFAPQDSKTLTIIGPGQEGLYTSIFLMSEFNFTKVNVISRSEESFLRFKENIKKWASYPIHIARASDTSSAIQQSDIIVCSSTSMHPILWDRNFVDSTKQSQFICGLTAFNDISTSLLNIIDNLIFDDGKYAKSRIEEVSKINLSGLGIENIYNMVQLDYSLKYSGINLYLPVGISAMDIAIANHFYQKIVAQKLRLVTC